MKSCESFLILVRSKLIRSKCVITLTNSYEFKMFFRHVSNKTLIRDSIKLYSRLGNYEMIYNMTKSPILS